MISPTTKRTIQSVVLTVPTLFLCGFVYGALDELNHAPTFRFPITGYDPVSLLHGHYIQFQIDSDFVTNAPSYYETKNKDWHVCIKQASDEPFAKAIFLPANTKEEDCAVITLNTNLFAHYGGNKFFVDERKAAQLDTLFSKAQRIQNAKREIEYQKKNPLPTKPLSEETLKLAQETAPQFSVDVAISESGPVRFKALYIDGKPWTEAINNPKYKDE
ncbi:MAG: hypothetical protein EOM37_08375 [Proteobacteria bacterium]|jgi:hypothetical protein|nr:GDYXXLXY domain-containing protein [Alphaproteobacteria bacterium]NCC04043.1 hypothetical protein [Pseudomonadota bacterium]